MRINTLFILLVLLIHNSSINANQPKVFECEYLLEASGVLKTDANQIEVPASITVRYKVITDGLFYLVIGQLQQASVDFTNLVILDKEHIDSMFFVKDKGLIFDISNRTYSIAETAIIDSSVIKDLSLKYQKIDSTRFYIDSIYQRIITPFPQFSGNRFGIVKIISKKGTCTLKSVREIDFSFETIQKQVRSYIYSQDKIHLPL